MFEAEQTPAACCPYRATGDNLDFAAYNSAADAAHGHEVMVDKWGEK